MINYQEKKNELENVWNAWIFSTNVNKRPKALCCPEATKKAMLTKKKQNILVPFSSLKLSATFSRPDSDGGSFRYERHFYDSLSHKVTQTKLLLGKKGERQWKADESTCSSMHVFAFCSGKAASEGNSGLLHCHVAPPARHFYLFALTLINFVIINLCYAVVRRLFPLRLRLDAKVFLFRCSRFCFSFN